MYYVDLYSLLNQPEKDWQMLLEQPTKDPPMPSLFDWGGLEIKKSDSTTVQTAAEPDIFVPVNFYRTAIKKIIALRPEWEEKIGSEDQTPVERIRLVMTREKDDDPKLRELIGSDEDRNALDVLFKNPDSNFKIAIVVSMWITGFDVPCLDTMYIDKPLQKHTLVQTISRVNRVYEGKDKGLVIDYIGIKSNMNNALKQYAGGGDMGANVETIDQSVTMVKDELDILRRMFHTFDYSKFSTGTPLEQLECLNHAAEFVQVTEKTQN